MALGAGLQQHIQLWAASGMQTLHGGVLHQPCTPGCSSAASPVSQGESQLSNRLLPVYQQLHNELSHSGKSSVWSRSWFQPGLWLHSVSRSLTPNPCEGFWSLLGLCRCVAAAAPRD